MHNDISRYAQEIIQSHHSFLPPEEIAVYAHQSTTIPYYIQAFLNDYYEDLTGIAGAFRNGAAKEMLALRKCPVMLHNRVRYEFSRHSPLMSTTIHNDFVVTGRANIVKLNFPTSQRTFIVIAQEWQLSVETWPYRPLAVMRDAAAWEYWSRAKGALDAANLTYSRYDTYHEDTPYTPDFIIRATEKLFAKGREERDMWRAIIALGNQQ